MLAVKAALIYERGNEAHRKDGPNSYIFVVADFLQGQEHIVVGLDL